MAAMPYKYQRLKSNSREIRMLQIYPTWRRSSTIKCSLVTADLDKLDSEAVPFSFYEALSYTWGDATGKVTIKLDGCPFEVTRNLAAALRRLRARRGYRYLWVDAVCINQADEQERNSQVALMGLIYRTAEQVLIWLGREADGSKGAMKLIDNISNIGVEESDVAASLANEAHRARWQNVARLFDRSYWRRVWVRQEIALAKGIVVPCGDQMMSWDALIEAAIFLNENTAEFEPIAAELTRYTSGYHDAIGMDILREMILKENHVPLEDVILHLRQCDCTDQRDKVYGALGLVGPEVDVPIDYGLDKVTTRGVVVDTISEVCAVYDNDATLCEVLEEWRTLAMKTLQALRPPPSDDEMRSCFWRTITANEELRGLAASEGFIAQALEHIEEDSSDAIPPIDLRYGQTAFNERFREDATHRRFYATENGYVGLGPSDVKSGDLVVVLLGNVLPLVLRKEDDHHLVVGETYTHGIMNGEIALDLNKGSLCIDDFEIY
ncbi:hypothetical protein Hte_012172 [Hypoxylon texense]